MIQITLNRQRTVELKKVFHQHVADDLAQLGLNEKGVVINLVEVPEENCSFGIRGRALALRSLHRKTG